jgi:hypothetical protein
MGDEEAQNGYEQELAEYETQLAQYLQQRIKPNLTPNTIPLVARSIAKEIARREPPEPADGGDVEKDGKDDAPDFEADMHECQAELGDDWILRFSVHGEEGWLTAEATDSSQRVEAPTAAGLLAIVEAIKEAGGRRA